MKGKLKIKLSKKRRLFSHYLRFVIYHNEQCLEYDFPRIEAFPIMPPTNIQRYIFNRYMWKLKKDKSE